MPILVPQHVRFSNAQAPSPLLEKVYKILAEIFFEDGVVTPSEIDDLLQYMKKKRLLPARFYSSPRGTIKTSNTQAPSTLSDKILTERGFDLEEGIFSPSEIDRLEQFVTAKTFSPTFESAQSNSSTTGITKTSVRQGKLPAFESASPTFTDFSRRR